MGKRYASDIIVTVDELELLAQHIQESYCKSRNDGNGYGRLPEYRLTMQLIKRAEAQALKATFS